MPGTTPAAHPRVKALGGARWGTTLVEAHTDQFGGWKGLLPAGAVPVAVPLNPEPVRSSEPVLAMRQPTPTEQDTAGRWSYLRQVERTNAAAPVAPGAKKPTSVSSLERVENRARVLAT